MHCSASGHCSAKLPAYYIKMTLFDFSFISFFSFLFVMQRNLCKSNRSRDCISGLLQLGGICFFSRGGVQTNRPYFVNITKRKVSEDLKGDIPKQKWKRTSIISVFRVIFLFTLALSVPPLWAHLQLIEYQMHLYYLHGKDTRLLFIDCQLHAAASIFVIGVVYKWFRLWHFAHPSADKIVYMK